MKQRDQNTTAAAVIYVIFSVFCACVLAIWTLTPPAATLAEKLSPPGATALFFTILFLLASSVVLGLLLLRRGATFPLMAFGGVLAAVGFSWNVIAGVFWLSPLFFVWRAMRRVEVQ
jgi:hypothetical protein